MKKSELRKIIKEEIQLLTETKSKSKRHFKLMMQIATLDETPFLKVFKDLKPGYNGDPFSYDVVKLVNVLDDNEISDFVKKYKLKNV